LARVWLASNLEKKLSKQNILSEKLDTTVKDIIGQGQAPIALRLSGQLLLGVVRIYSRKARYLLDDCSEALGKIRMAFRPGNVDLPAERAAVNNPNALILPDTITDLDLFAPMPDPEELLRETPSTRMGRDPTLLDFGTSQLLSESQTPSKRQEKVMLEDFGLDLDIGLDPVETSAISLSGGIDRSIEVGRRAPSVRRDEPSLLGDDDLGLDLGFDDSTIRGTSTHPPHDHGEPLLAVDEDYSMGGMPVNDDDQIAEANAEALRRASAAAEQRRRNSASPLSNIGEHDMNDLERTFQLDQAGLNDEEADETMVQAAQRVKRRRVMTQDAETELHNSQIRKQQDDRSAITRPAQFLPRDPVLLQLMEMQRNGGFVSNIMGDGRMQGWAPELRGILSVEVVKRAGDKKRKRDSGIADMQSERDDTPRLEIPQDDGIGFNVGDDANPTLRSSGIMPLILDDAAPPAVDEDHSLNAGDLGDFAGTPGPAFDVTEAPLLHPSQSGPVSLGTKNAVHLLREHFAPGHAATSAAPPTPSRRVKSEALFTDLCPEATTSRQDATKMFFEMLVLGTKDAIKVEQDAKELAMPIRVRGKRGLWGSWAERGAGGEIAQQEGAHEGVQES
jgi:cohesin complex subunit SCC1